MEQRSQELQLGGGGDESRTSVDVGELLVETARAVLHSAEPHADGYWRVPTDAIAQLARVLGETAT